MPLREDRLVYESTEKMDPRLRVGPPMPRRIVWEPLGVSIPAYEDEGGARRFPFAEALVRLRASHPDAWLVLERAGVEAPALGPQFVEDGGTD